VYSFSRSPGVERAKGRGLHDRECLRLFGFVPLNWHWDGFLNRNGLGLGVALVFNLVGHVVRDFRAFGAQRLAASKDVEPRRESRGAAPLYRR